MKISDPKIRPTFVLKFGRLNENCFGQNVSELQSPEKL